MTESAPKEKLQVKKTLAKKIAALVATVLWVVGFGLNFVIKPGERLIWMPDSFLLIGFWPLLFVYKAGWTWFGFGACNMVIGFFLELMRHLPQDVFKSQDQIIVRDHLIQMHVPIIWILIGAASAAYGVFRMVKTVAKWILKRSKKSAAAEPEHSAQPRHKD